MKKTGFALFVLVFALLAWGQQAQPPATQPQQAQPQQAPASLQQGVQETLPPPPPSPTVAKTNLVERAAAPTYSDFHCAGFVTDQLVPEGTYVTAGWDTPSQTRFADRQYIYLTGSGFQEGQQYAIIRKLRDPNRWEAYQGQHGDIGTAGQPYADIGHVTIVQGGARGNTAIAVVTFSCDGIVPHDLAVPYVDLPIPKYKDPGPFDPFAPANGKTAGRIILAKSWDQVLGAGRVVYLDIGADKGVKPGDYFHVTRTYGSLRQDAVDRYTFKASTVEDTQALANVETSRIDELPRRSLGNLMIMNVSPKSSTGILTFTLEPVRPGDHVELFEPPPPPPPPPAVPTMPSITCTPNPATVKRGENSTVTCEASSPDNHPLTFSYSTSAGRVMPRDNTAVLDTTDVQPGVVSVTGTVTDDRSQTANSVANVTVEAPAAPPAPTSQTVTFARNSARVDNKAKAILDGVALQLQQMADATAVVIGHSDTGERKTLAMLRATNVKKYLTDSKGIDPKRIETRTSPTPGSTADVWILPAGTSLPAEAVPAEAPAPTEPPAPPPVKKKRTSAKKPAAAAAKAK